MTETASTKTTRKPPGLDELARMSRKRLKSCLVAQEQMQKAASTMSAMPRGEVVWAMLGAAHRKANKSFRAILDKEVVRAKIAAMTWARSVLDDPSTVILDSETTGLGAPVDFIEIAVIDRTGRTLFDSRLRPVAYVERPVSYVRGEDGTLDEVVGDPVRRPPLRSSEGALRVHGITEDDLRAAPSFPKMYPELLRILEGKQVIVYNAPYDADVWQQTVERYRLAPGDVDPESWGCAMRAFAGYEGEYRYERDQYQQTNPIPTSFRWQRLFGGHRALGDCRETLKLICKMAGRQVPEFGELPEVKPVPLSVLYAPPPPPAPPVEEDFDNIPF